MRSLLLAAAALFALASPAAGACRFKQPAVEIVMLDASLVIEDVRSVIDYTAFPWQTQNELAPGWSINGLTVARPTAFASFEGYWDGRCMIPNRITVTMSFEDPVRVYIADRYSRDTCQWQVIYQHEMQHVDIFRRGKILYGDRMKAMTDTAAALSAARGDDGDAFTAALKAAMDKVMEEFIQALGAAHGAIDTVENYRKTQAQCPGRW